MSALVCVFLSWVFLSKSYSSAFTFAYFEREKEEQECAAYKGKFDFISQLCILSLYSRVRK